MSIRPAEKPKVYDAQFNARLQRLERMVGQDSGGSGSDNLPHYDDNDVGKVLTVTGEYQNVGTAFHTQNVEFTAGKCTVTGGDASKWTEGRIVRVIFNDSTYDLEVTDAEGNLVVGNADFTISYSPAIAGTFEIETDYSTSVASVGAVYLEQHANADWAEPSSEPSGGIKELNQAEPFYVPDMETSGTKLFTPDVDECVLWGDSDKIGLNIFFVDTLEFPYIVNNYGTYSLTIGYANVVSGNPPNTASNYGFGVLPNKTCRILLGSDGPVGVVVEKESIAYYQCNDK